MSTIVLSVHGISFIIKTIINFATDSIETVAPICTCNVTTHRVYILQCSFQIIGDDLLL